MKYILLFLFPILVKSVTFLKRNDCNDIKHGPMEFKVCENLKEYNKYYFEDATGVNQITLVPDRLYKNHNYYTAYSTDKEIYIGKRLYKNEDWFKFRESYFK